MVPLREAGDTPEPILDTHEISTLFGPVEGIISCHELFYLALSSKASEWAEGNTIGDCVLSSVSVAIYSSVKNPECHRFKLHFDQSYVDSSLFFSDSFLAMLL